MEKINALSMPEKAIAGGGILMFIASFFDWWHASSQSVEIEGLGRISSGSFGASGWDAPGDIWSILAILVSVALAGIVIATKLGNVQMPALPPSLTWGQVWGGGAALVVVLMLLKAWRILAAPYGGFGIGFFIAVVATVAIAYGGYMMYAEEKGTPGFGMRR
jgi:hypothetical protein